MAELEITSLVMFTARAGEKCPNSSEGFGESGGQLDQEWSCWTLIHPKVDLNSP